LISAAAADAASSGILFCIVDISCLEGSNNDVTVCEREGTAPVVCEEVLCSPDVGVVCGSDADSDEDEDEDEVSGLRFLSNDIT
jgi:hypothetical protein